ECTADVCGGGACGHPLAAAGTVCRASIDGTDKGARVSFAEVSDLNACRHALQVEPDAARRFKPATFPRADWLWVGTSLYVADAPAAWRQREKRRPSG
ncbi:MAG: hypothetical protein IT380_16065, partial [Myxococcales bacterium]|nr:hypothetical protein [Myxococcales bacterium]